jgi:hypothetical protein
MVRAGDAAALPGVQPVTGPVAEPGTSASALRADRRRALRGERSVEPRADGLVAVREAEAELLGWR